MPQRTKIIIGALSAIILVSGLVLAVVLTVRAEREERDRKCVAAVGNIRERAKRGDPIPPWVEASAQVCDDRKMLQLELDAAKSANQARDDQQAALVTEQKAKIDARFDAEGVRVRVEAPELWRAVKQNQVAAGQRYGAGGVFVAGSVDHVATNEGTTMVVLLVDANAGAIVTLGISGSTAPLARLRPGSRFGAVCDGIIDQSGVNVVFTLCRPLTIDGAFI